jgi:hypothetical protein
VKLARSTKSHHFTRQSELYLKIVRTKKTTRTPSVELSELMDCDVKLRSDGSAPRAVLKSPLPKLSVMEGFFPFTPVSAEGRGLFTLALFLELFVDAVSLGGTLGAAAVRCECKMGGAVGSDGYVTGFTVQCARKCSPKTELYGFTTLPCCLREA